MGSATWNTDQAHELCVLVEAIATKYGCHVALTGGCLYTGGERKDVDILFYRIRQADKIDVAGLFVGLAAIGLVRRGDAESWCIKAMYRPSWSDVSKEVDCFFPELEGDYSGDKPKENP